MNTRREFIGQAVRMGLLLAGGSALLSSCGGGSREHVPASCDDLTGVPEEEIGKRKKLGYVASTPIPDSKCSNCKLYLPPAKGSKCGGCSLFKGPVHADGYCTYYAPLT